MRFQLFCRRYFYVRKTFDCENKWFDKSLIAQCPATQHFSLLNQELASCDFFLVVLKSYLSLFSRYT